MPHRLMTDWQAQMLPLQPCIEVALHTLIPVLAGKVCIIWLDVGRQPLHTQSVRVKRETQWSE